MYPMFLGIGAQKAGTTWLHHNLGQHPEIWLPRIKEIHYFDNMNEGRAAQWRRLKTRRRLRRALGYLARDTYHLSWEKVQWDVHFFFKRRTHDWYFHVFEPGAGKVTGDITPAYSTLSDTVVAHVTEIMPYARIIYLMRNPIEWVWSAILMNIKKGICGFEDKKGQYEHISYDEFVRSFERREVKLRGDYLRTLQTWQRHFFSDQLYIAFLEDVARRPRELLLEIYSFLDISTDPSCLPGAPEKPVLKGRKKMPMPAEVGRYLAQRYYPMIEELKLMFSGRERCYIEEWQKRAESLLAHRVTSHQPVIGGERSE